MGKIFSGFFLVCLLVAVILSCKIGLSDADQVQKAGPRTAQISAVSLGTYPLEQMNTTSPRGTIRDFQETMDRAYKIQTESGYRSKKAVELLERAENCLDLSKVPPTFIADTGIESVLLLKEILDRIPLPPYGEIPDSGTMESKGWSRWIIPHTELTIARVKEGPREGEYLFTPGTIARLSTFFKTVESLPYKPGAAETIYESFIYSPGWMIPHEWIESLPEWADTPFFGQTLWQWISMCLLLLVGVLLMWWIYRLEFHRSPDNEASPWQVGKLIFPISGMALSLIIDYFVDEQINITGDILTIVSIGMKLIFFGFAAIFIFLSGNILVKGIMASPRLKPKTIDGNLISLSIRVITLLVLFGLVWYAAGDFGLSVTAIFASAGVVGIAVALAARETLANFFGGVSILLDRPFKTGDYIVLDSGERGEVMEIGLRSTRILTRDEILICVPNSLITNIKVINESAPAPSFRVRIKVGVAYGTDINRVEEILIELAKKSDLAATEPEPRVRFRAFGDSSLDFELLCWARRPHDKGRLIHTLNSAIYWAFNDAGIVIPFPQRDIHLDPVPVDRP